jgi:hypothetical protein
VDLEAQTDRRLRAAGITEDDLGLARIRAHNAQAYARRDREQRSNSGGDHRGRGTNRGGNSPDRTVETRQRPGTQPANVVPLRGSRRAGLRHV